MASSEKRTCHVLSMRKAAWLAVGWYSTRASVGGARGAIQGAGPGAPGPMADEVAQGAGVISGGAAVASALG